MHHLTYKWLQHVNFTITTGIGTLNVSWSAFHASHDDDPGDAAITTSCLLPLFQEDAATVAMV